jgi:ankyrin repeat protein
MVELLLDQGAKIEDRDENGQTPFSLAVGSIYYYSPQIGERVMLLVSRGADLLSKDNEGLMPLDHAKKDEVLRRFFPSIISFLREKTAELGYIDDDPGLSSSCP